jgi:hypothetical protein
MRQVAGLESVAMEMRLVGRRELVAMAMRPVA